MNAKLKCAVALALLSETAYAQQPPDVVTSDGYENSAMGTGALLTVTPSTFTGNGNTAVGAAALTSNTTGAYNTAAGHNALATNTTGISNTAIGSSALYFNTTGKFNTASGVGALFLNGIGVRKYRHRFLCALFKLRRQRQYRLRV